MNSKGKIKSVETLALMDEVENAEERERYRELLTEWKKKECNKERCHKEWRDGRSFEVLETSPPLHGIRKPQKNTNLREQTIFEDIIFSKNPDDLHELVSDGILSSIIKGLTAKQKEVIYYKVIKRHTEKKIGKILGISDRRVREIYEAAMSRIRGKMYPIIKFRRKLETDEKYKDYARKKDIYTTKAERNFLEKADGKVRNYYDK